MKKKAQNRLRIPYWDDVIITEDDISKYNASSEFAIMRLKIIQKKKKKAAAKALASPALKKEKEEEKPKARAITERQISVYSAPYSSADEIKEFVDALCDPHTTELLYKTDNFEHNLTAASEEVSTAYDSNNDASQSIPKAEDKGTKKQFDTLVDRWKKRLEKKHEKLGTMFKVLKQDCMNDVRSELQKALGELDLAKMEKIPGLHCSAVKCTRQKTRLKKEVVLLKEECAMLRRVNEKLVRKRSASVLQQAEINLANSQWECKATRERLDSLLSQTKQETTELKSQLFKLSEDQVKLRQCEKDLQAQQSLSNSLQSQKAVLSGKVAKLKTQLKGREDKISEFRTVMNSLTAQNAEQAKLIEKSGKAELLGKLRELLQCPIAGVEMKDPAVCSDGHTYERSAILEWRNKNPTSPITREGLAAGIYTNFLVGKIIELAKGE